jgi:hypothetical protein
MAVAVRANVKVGIVSAIAWALLDFASQHSERGSVTGFDPEVYAAYSGFAESEINAVLQAMTDKGILADGHFVNWDKRQPKSETAIERATRSRLLRDVAQDCGVLRDVAQETETESESESESDKEKSDGDAFFNLQRALETKGIVLSGSEDIKAIGEVISMGATVSDLLEGLTWKAANNHGKPVRYVSSLVGPARTAMQKRLQKGGGQPDPDHTLAVQREWLASLQP